MNIYVGNLNYNVSEDELRQVFEGYGEVSSAKVIMDGQSGRSKGFAFVEMPNDSEGKEAVENLDGAEIKGRPVKVNPARERESGSGRGFKPRR